MPRHIKTLLIEDNADHVMILKYLLEKIEGFTFTVEHAGDTVTARQKLKDHGIDLIFMDYHQGPNNGLEFLREQRAGGNHRPVIVLTAQGNEYVAVEVTRAGADEYIAKNDLNPTILAKAIDRAMIRGQIHLAQQHERDLIAGRLEKLTPREQEVLDLLVMGQSNKDIAAQLCRSEKTVKIHRGNIMRKLDAHSVAELVRLVLLVRGVGQAAGSTRPELSEPLR
ncbi:MAG: response regulator transcription factor [Phycisphaeraceae bacterium]|nr:response regulator transcription factor [Phycisphaeraceae bacterium]